MSYIRDYAISLMAASLLSMLLSHLLPKGATAKYIRTFIGLFMMLTLLAPLAKLPHFAETFALPQLRIGDSDLSLETKPYIARRFETELALAICEDVRQCLGKSISCRVRCETNEAGQIIAIRFVQIDPFDEGISAHIAKTFGIEEAFITP